MDTNRFDQIAAGLSAAQNRRGILQIIGAGALAVGGLGALALEESDARRKRRKSKKNKHKRNGANQPQDAVRCLNAGDRCSFDDQCCASTTKRICDVALTASNSDKTCCGGEGAACGGVNADGDAIGPICCVGSAGVRSFVCSQNDPNTPFVAGTCIPAPEI